MALRILFYFGLLAIGWLLSNKGFFKEKFLIKISHVQSMFLFFLIFVMGIRLGMDKQVVASIGQIGIKAFVFGLITAGFSVIFVYFTRKRLINDKAVTGGK